MSRSQNSPVTAAIGRRALLCGAAGAIVSLGLPERAHAGLAPSDETWNVIKSDLFDDPTFLDGDGIVALGAPDRAHDASIVPLDITVDPGRGIERLSIVIDENPVPLAARIAFGPASAAPSIQTRVRVNAYSYVRAIAHAGDGAKYMVKKFVKASGGCAAPSGKDPAAAEVHKGEMRLRRFAKAEPREAQVMVRHPNHTGFQMDQVSLLFIPPDFVETIDIRQGGDMILRVESGISLSEDPNLRFFYRENPALPIQVTAKDTEGRIFTQSWSASDA